MTIPHPIRNIIALIAVLLTSCQMSPRVPEVVATVKVKILGGNGVAAINTKTGYIYVAGSINVTIIKGIKSIGEVETGGREVTSMAVDEANDLVYVVNQYSDNVTVIRGAERIGIVPTVGHSPRSVAIEPNSHLAYIVSGYRSHPLTGDSVGSDILVLNGNKVIDNLRIEGRVLLTQVVADPVSGYIYAADAGEDVIVLKGLQEVARYKTPPSIAQNTMTVDPRTGEVYVLSGATLYRFKEGKMIDSVKIKDNEVDAIRVHPMTGDVYIPHWGHEIEKGNMLILRNMKEIGELKVGERPHAMTIDPLTGNIYVASFLDNTVTVVNGTQVLATINVGQYPYNVVVNPTNGWVYVSNTYDGTVSVLGYPQETGRQDKTTITIKTPVPSRPYP